MSGSCRSIPSVVDGIEYPSMAAAALAMGITRQAISLRIAVRARGPVKRGRPPALHELDGVVATVAEHARRRGVSVQVIYRKLRRARTA